MQRLPKVLIVIVFVGNSQFSLVAPHNMEINRRLIVGAFLLVDFFFFLCFLYPFSLVGSFEMFNVSSSMVLSVR